MKKINTEKMPDNGYRKPNNCPYCGYYCDAALMHEDDKTTPNSGDLSFCLMCCKPSQFDDDMNLIKFDIDSIDDVEERDRLHGIEKRMNMFWESNPELKEKRVKQCNH